MSVFKAVPVTERVYWVGAVDWGIRDFHGYSTGRGSTYNAYLVLGEKTALIDTVKAPFYSEMMARITSVTDPKKIDVIVSNHSEMDHSGSLPRTMETVNPESVYASRMGAKALKAHFHWDDDAVTAVESGDSLDLGGMKLNFLETRMLHWPDSMFSFLEEEGILFTQDGFGMHLASSERFDDQLQPGILQEEARKYYANILTPFSPLVGNLIRKLQGMDLDVKMMCPDHGPIWRSRIPWIIDKWLEWSEQKPVRKAVVVYDTMWGSTARMARAVAQGLTSEEISTKVMPLSGTHISDVAAEVLEASALVVGSPTINGRIFPSVAECMNYLGGLKPRNLTGAAFGSYGWSGEAVGELNGLLEGMKVKLLNDGERSTYVPDSKELEKYVDLGRDVAAEVIRMCEGEE